MHAHKVHVEGCMGNKKGVNLTLMQDVKLTLKMSLFLKYLPLIKQKLHIEKAGKL